MAPDAIYAEDEIDLRELILTLWNAKLLIIGVSFLAAAAAFVLSAFVLSRRYEATAYVSIRDPIIQFAAGGGVSIDPVVPDIKAAAKLAESDGLLQSVIFDPSIAALWEDETPSLKGMVEVEVAGDNQLQLQITDTDPRRAALLANAWAARLVDSINRTYGVEAVAQSLDSQVEHARREYEQAQAAWEEALSQSEVSALSARLGNARNDLNCALNVESALDRVLDDLQMLEWRLDDLADESGVPFGDALALNTLQQRALTSRVCLTGSAQELIVQVGSDSLDLTSEEARRNIAQIRETLESQREIATSRKAQLEAEIPQLESALEDARAQVDRLAMAKEQAKRLYDSLTEQQGRASAVLMQSATVAAVSAEAVAPEKPSSPKVLMNTALAGFVGMFAAIGWAFAAAWWRGSER